MEETINKIFEKLKSLIIVDVADDKLKFDVELILQESLNYMNRTDFPQELELTVVKYLVENIGKKESSNLKAMSVGDTKLEYIEIDPAKAILDLRKQLNRFRKVGTI